VNPPPNSPGWPVIGIYSLALALFGWLIVHFDLPDSLLFVFWVPCMLAPFFYRRRVYRTMIAILVIASILVTARVSGSFTTSLVTIAVAAGSGLVIAEMLRALTMARAQTEQTLKESEQRFRTLADNMPVMVNAITETEQFTFWNKACEVITGYTREEIIGNPEAMALIYPDPAYRAQLAREWAEAGKLYENKEVVLTAKDGSQHHILWSNLPAGLTLTDNDTWAVGVDITERKHAEEALQEKTAELDRFFSNAIDLLCIADTDGYFRRLNAEWEKTLGYTLDELEGRRFLDFVHPDDLAATLETIAALDEGRGVFNFTNRYRRKDGAYRWIEWRSYPAGNLIYAAARDITKRLQAEEALRESEALLDMFFTQSLDGFFFMMLDTPVVWNDTVDKEAVLDYVFTHQRITQINAAMLAQYGATREQFLGLTPHDLFANDIAHGRTVWRIFFDAGRLHIDKEERKLDGTPMWIEGDYISLYDAQGRITGHFGVQREVTQQRQMLQTLQAQEQFVSTLNDITLAALESSRIEDVIKILATRVGELFHAAGCYITLWDEETQTVIPRAAYGKWHEGYHETTLEPGESTVTEAVLRAGQPIAIDDVYNTPYLSRRFADPLKDWSVLGLPLLADERKLGAALIAYSEPHQFTPLEIARGEQVARQIALAIAKALLYQELQAYTEQLETQVQVRTAELQSQYAQLEAILRSVGDAIFMTDAQQRILYVNPAFTTLTGYPATEVLGQNVYTLAALADFAPRLPSIIPTLTQGKLWQGAARARRKNGRHYDAALTIAPVYDDAGQLTGHVFTHRDISQAKDLERARAQFITSVSHQFRSSLTPLKAGIYLLQRAPLADKHQQQLHLMEAAVNGFILLLEDIEQMLILDSGKGVEDWEPVSLPVIVAEVLERYHDQAQAAGLTLAAAPIPTLPPIQGDAERLRQALGELVENAVIFTPAGGQINITVQVSSIGEETWVTIAVRDTGPGLKDEELPHLFERFFRGHLTESKHIPGIGLGLSIAQQIAEAHGGRITVESTVGQGSTFTLWIRATVSQADM